MKNNLNIGKKIYEMRTQKLMTQAELAGDHITRNMLSSIEHGSALPSVPTIIYLASRLNVPPGYLLADESDEYVYKKMQKVSDIKKAYASGEYRICKHICLDELEERDDEINLLLAECSLRIAIEEFESGNLHAACRELDEALSFSRQTIYTTDHIKDLVGVYFGYLSEISPLLYSNDEGDEKEADDVSGGFIDFAKAYQAFIDQDIQSAEEYVSKNSDIASPYLEFISALLKENEGDFASAKRILTDILRSPDRINELMLYNIFDRLERYCKETGDYKGAYEYSKDKLRTYEHLLEK